MRKAVIGVRIRLARRAYVEAYVYLSDGVSANLLPRSQTMLTVIDTEGNTYPVDTDENIEVENLKVILEEDVR